MLYVTLVMLINAKADSVCLRSQVVQFLFENMQQTKKEHECMSHRESEFL